MKIIPVKPPPPPLESIPDYVTDKRKLDIEVSDINKQITELKTFKEPPEYIWKTIGAARSELQKRNAEKAKTDKVMGELYKHFKKIEDKRKDAVEYIATLLRELQYKKDIGIIQMELILIELEYKINIRLIEIRSFLRKI